MKKPVTAVLALVLSVFCFSLPQQAAAAPSGTEDLTQLGDGSIVSASGDVGTRAAVAGFGSNTEGRFESGTVRDMVRSIGLRLNAQARTCAAWSKTLEAEGRRIQAKAENAAQKPPVQEPQVQQSAPSHQTINPEPFYGLWCAATTDFSSAQAIAWNLTLKGFDARVYQSSDWSNLNPDPWYVVTTGAYATRGAAEADLPAVRAIYGDSYVKYSGSYIGQRLDEEPDVPEQTEEPDEPVAADRAPFYGVWCAASKDYAEAQRYASELTRQGYDGQVFLSTDWSNLNRQPWYVVTAGVYSGRESAEDVLPEVQRLYSDAYVKYTGSWQG